jgi:SAM-dependent methyltransferase
MGTHEGTVREQFTAQVERFLRAPHVNAPEPLARLLALAAPRPKERAIDVGCGPGLLVTAVAPRLASITGFDITPAMVVKAREVAGAAGAANARFAVADARALPVRDGSVDLALTRLALHHMLDPGAALAEMARAVRPGGRVAIFDLTTSEAEEEAAYQDRVERLRDPSHVRALPLSEIVRLAGRARLEAVGLDAMDFPIDVEDWIARAEQSREAADEARRLIAAAIGTRRFGGKKVWRDERGGLHFTARWVMLLASKPADPA